MTYSLYFSGRAQNKRQITAFVSDLRLTASNLGLKISESDTAALIIDFGTGADELIIEFNEAFVIDGSIKPSSDRQDKDLRTMAVLFGSAYELLNVFELVDDEGRVLLSHGDVDGLEAYLESEILADEKSGMPDQSSGREVGSLDTQWYSHARVLNGHRLEVSEQARSRINDLQWETLRGGIAKLKGVASVAHEQGTTFFEFTLEADPSPEDSKRIAIASSFMIDDAIENSAA